MMQIAQLIAQRSTCNRLQVGTVITNNDMTTINAIGYNGGARGLKNECESDEPGKCGHIHSEENALIKADYNIKNKKIFITCSPCKQCAKKIVNAKISQVYFAELYRDPEPMQILSKANINVFQVDVKKNDFKFFHINTLIKRGKER